MACGFFAPDWLAASLHSSNGVIDPVIFYSSLTVIISFKWLLETAHIAVSGLLMDGNYSPTSQIARLLARCGAISLWLGWSLAIPLILCALTFMILLAEPLPHRLMSLAFLGVLPALVAATTGSVLARVLRLTASICDQIIIPQWQHSFQHRNAPMYLRLADPKSTLQTRPARYRRRPEKAVEA